MSVTSSRADHGILGRVWQAIAARPELTLEGVATGMNAVDPAGLHDLLPPGTPLHWVGRDIGGADARTATDAVARSVADWGALLADRPVDLLLLAGDRLDMLPAAIAALPARVPIVHLHGGEVTLGAFDEQIRHALSKMAHLHGAAFPAAAARLCRMGEEPWRIHVTGSPALDSLMALSALDRRDFRQAVGLGPASDGTDPADRLRLVTVHPETNAADPLAPARAVAAALTARPAPTLVTAANSDPGGAKIRALFASLAAQHPWITLTESLGTGLYRSALAHADVMIGNSSSGLIEAPVFGLRVINVGRRQDGRPTAPAIATVPAEAAAVIAAIDRLSDPAAAAPSPFSAFGDGRAAGRIADILARAPDRTTLLDKGFFDGPPPPFPAPWDLPAR